ncbi:hypothetical protein JCM5353_008007 [Sporobolomyces roseus]
MYPQSTQVQCTAIYDELDREERALTADPTRLTLGLKEKIANLERVNLYLLTGSARQIPAVAWRQTRTLQTILKTGFIYFDATVMDLITGIISAARYAPETAEAALVHPAAIGYQFGRPIGQAALTLGRLELQILKTAGGQLVPRHPMNLRKVNGIELLPHVKSLVLLYLGELRKSALRALSTNSNKKIKDAQKLVDIALDNDRVRREDESTLLAEQRVKLIVALDQWGQLSASGSFDEKAFQPLQAVLDRIGDIALEHNATEKTTISKLVDIDVVYTYINIARTFTIALFPTCAIAGDPGDLIKKFPAIKSDSPVFQMGQVIGAEFGCTPKVPISNLAPQDFIEAVCTVLREEITVFPRILGNASGACFSFKEFHLLADTDPSCVSADEGGTEYIEYDSDSSNDPEVSAGVARTLNPLARYITADQLSTFQNGLGLGSYDPQTGEFEGLWKTWTDVSKSYLTSINAWAATHNAKQGLGETWVRRYCNAWKLLVLHLKRDNEFHQLIIIKALLLTAHPTNEYPLINDKKWDIPLTLDRISYANDSNRSRSRLVPLFACMTMFYFLPAATQTSLLSGLTMSKFVLINNARKLDTRFLQLAGFGQARSVRPAWPEPIANKFQPADPTTVVAELAAIKRAYHSRDYRSLFEWCYSYEQTTTILRFYLPNFV